jgi:leucyl aminopeptidase (aminopeptidase T)
MGLTESAKIAVEVAMGLKSNEIALIICDEKSRKIGYVLLNAANIAKEAILIEMKEMESNGEEPPELVANTLLHCDVALIPTTKSMSHTKARKAACDKGVRIATLPGITEDMMERALDVDYKEMELLSNKFTDLLTHSKNIEINTELGTNLRFSIDERQGHSDTGICHNPGDFSNLPAGESCIAPVEGTSSGTLIIDGSLAGYGLLKNPLKIKIENGFIKDLEGDGADFLKEVYNKYGVSAWNVAELGIGTNPKATITGNVLEDEKVKGTIHIAFGDNISFGGTVSVDSHLDGVIMKPTLILDGKVIIKEGELLI